MYLFRHIKMRSSQGFSVVELLVALAISGIILAGVVGTVLSSRTTFLSEEEGSFMQENARYALEVLSRELRLAGYGGCASGGTASFSNVLDASVFDGLVTAATGEILPIEGFPDASGNFPAYMSSSITADTDAVVVRFADASEQTPIRFHDAAASRITFHDMPDIEANDIALISDANCRSFGVFAITAASAGDNRIEHASGGDNCSSVIKASNGEQLSCYTTPCSGSACGGSTDANFTPGSTFMPFLVHIYYIEDSVIMPGQGSLKRAYLTEKGLNVEELVQGVESMTIRYGVNADNDEDQTIESFVEAGDVADWNLVRSVKFDLVLRSRGFYHENPVVNPFSATGASDRFLRQLVSHTVKLRNI